MRRPKSKLLALVVLVVFLVISPLSAQAGQDAAASSGSSWASWYGGPFHGRVMANGEVYNMWDPTTTASNWFPFNTWVRVTNPANGKSVTVRVTDRGHFDWAFDLSYAAFASIANPSAGKIRITYQVVSGPSSTVVKKPAPTPTPKPVVKTTTTESRPQLSSRSSARPAAVARPANTEFRSYFVRAGDTLSSIAQLFGVDLRSLIDANRITNPNLIYPQQQLSIPEPENGDVAIYGDTVHSIAERNGVAVRDVLAVNDRPLEYVYPGQVVRLP